MRGCAALVFLQLLACGSETTVYLAPPTGLETPQTLILFDAAAGAPIAVSSLEAPLKWAQTSADGTVWLLAYEAPLSELGLVEGALDATNCRSCALVFPSAVYRAVVLKGGEQVSEWELREQAEPGVLDALVPDRDPRCLPCLELEATALEVPGLSPSDAMPTVGLADGSVVFSDALSGRFFQLESTGSARPLCEAGAGPVPTAMATRPDGKLWAGDALGQLFEVDLARMQENLPCGDAIDRIDSPPLDQIIRELIDDQSGNGVVLALASVTATTVEMEIYTTFFRHDDSGWTALHTFEDIDGNQWGLISPAEGEVRACTGAFEYLVYEDGRVRQRSPEVEGINVEVTTLAYIEPYGVVLGTQNNRLVFEDGDQKWRSAIADLPPTNLRIDQATSFRGRIVLANQRGRFGQFVPLPVQYCDPTMTLTRETSVKHLLPLGPDALFASGTPQHILRPKWPDECGQD